MTHRYKLQPGPDGIVWLSLQPMLEDIKQQMDNTTQQHVYDALFTVKTFIESLIDEAAREQKLQEIEKSLKACETEPTYRDSLQ